MKARTNYRAKPISIKAMAEIIGVSPTHLKAVLSGKSPMSNRIAKHMNHLIEAMHDAPVQVKQYMALKDTTLEESIPESHDSDEVKQEEEKRSTLRLIIEALQYIESKKKSQTT